MGFRDLHFFNLALLAKQGWRLATQPTSLFSRVFQSKYFPRCSFWQAKLGSSPSFIWRSILAARDLFRKGIRWSIRDGKAVKIWEDDWGVCDLKRCPHVRKVEWVSDLIDGVRGTWNLPVLCELFDADSVDKIKQISLRDTRGPDSFSWKLHSIRVFTVKTAYNLVVSPEVRGVEGENSNRTQHRQFWRVLWKLKIPHKVKIHLWRAYLNVLPTRLSLCRWRVLSEPTCPIYNAVDKTTTHAIWSCPYNESVWALAPSFFQNMPSVDIDFFLLSCKIFRDTSRKHIEIWVVTSWAIWYSRNQFFHGHPFPSPQDKMDLASRLLNDFHIVNAMQSMTPLVHHNC
jgi:hypothetical protein